MIHLVPPYQGIIFDLDGTIADTMPLHYQASQEVCHEYGFDFPLTFFLSEAGRPTVEVFIDLMSMLQNGLDGKKLAAAKEKRFMELLHQVKPIEEVLAVAEFYHHKLPLAIGSGGDKKAVMQTLENLGIKNMFDSIVSADDVTKHKPFPDTFLTCAHEMGVLPEKCVVFEDGPPGITAAKRAKMGVIDVNNYLTPRFS